MVGSHEFRYYSYERPAWAVPRWSLEQRPALVEAIKAELSRDAREVWRAAGCFLVRIVSKAPKENHPQARHTFVTIDTIDPQRFSTCTVQRTGLTGSSKYIPKISTHECSPTPWNVS
ncbi:hypothetical protein V1478_007603 [Vespula squamosa]|uniref:Uncharacterized protein n=1 Tax=Vespula squamosa TaxID=30214 RepID=A0ABD2B3M5_VESSQ